ncbi:MAG: DUF5801 repeats-in-toxin domain-containing protein, partial [Erythrobacter sp.]
ALSYVVSAGSIVASANGAPVFTMTLDADGTWAFTLEGVLDHPVNSTEDDIAIEFAGLVVATDADGDSVTATGSLVVTVDDDMPSVTVTGEPQPLVVDDSDFASDASFDYSDVFTLAYGADGAASGGGESYALGVGAGSSGLTDTLTGEAVVLTLEGGQVVGRTEVGGDIVFVVSVDASGTVTLDQQRSVYHADPTADNEPTGLASGDLITLSASATDGDGDSASETISIGSDLVFLDDAPSVGSNAEVQLDDETQAGGIAGGMGDVDPDTANTGGTLAHDFGNDGGTIAFLTSGAPAGFQYVASGDDILVQQMQGGSWVTVVTVTLNPDSGAYTVTQNANVLHAAGADENDASFTLTYRVTDGDLDTEDGALTITVDDDTPVANDLASLSGSVDEDALAGGIEGGVGDIDAGAGTVGLATGGSVAALFASGADSPLSYAFETAASSQTYLTGLGLSSGTVALSYVVSAGSIVASANGAPVFTMTLDADGTWAFTLEGVLDHPANSTEDDIAIEFAGLVVATDADGDSVTATGSLVVTVDDDMPVAVAPVAVEVTNGASAPTAPIALDGDGTLSDNYGADGPGTVRFLASLDGMDSGLTSSFQPITYVLDDDQTLRGVAGGQTIFTVTLDPASGTYVVDMDGSIDSVQNIEFNPVVAQFVGGNGSWTGFVPIGDSVTSPNDDDSLDLLLTPSIDGVLAGTINSTANSGGVDGGASVGSGETFRVDFVVDLRGNPADTTQNDYAALANRDHVFDGHYIVNGATALLKSTTGSTVQITAFDDADGNTVVGDGAIDTITGVAITWRGTPWVGGNGEAIIIQSGTYTINGRDFTVTFNNDGTVSVAGVEGDPGSSQVGTQIAVFTDDGFNSVEYTWQAGDTFQIGGFGATTLTTDPVSFDLPVEVVDGDGDVSSSGNIHITAVTPDPMMAEALASDVAATKLASASQFTAIQGAELVAANDTRQADARSVGMMALAAAASGLDIEQVSAAAHDQQFANSPVSGSLPQARADAMAQASEADGGHRPGPGQIDLPDPQAMEANVAAQSSVAPRFDPLPPHDGLQMQDGGRSAAPPSAQPGVEQPIGHDFAGALSFAQPMAGMEQLLVLAQQGAAGIAADRPNAQNALTQIAQDVGMDNLIDHFAPAAGQAPGSGPAFFAEAPLLAAFLDQQVGSHHAGAPAIDILHDAAAMAEAAIHA